MCCLAAWLAAYLVRQWSTSDSIHIDIECYSRLKLRNLVVNLFDPVRTLLSRATRSAKLHVNADGCGAGADSATVTM